jgi:hypothetical protein
VYELNNPAYEMRIYAIIVCGCLYNSKLLRISKAVNNERNIEPYFKNH